MAKTSFVNLGILTTVLFLATIAIFDVSPVVREARKVFPEQFGDACGCLCVLKSRPWYGQINPWLWFWIISTPLIVFSMTPDARAWKRALRTVFIIALSYPVILIATVKHFDIINAPFNHSELIYTYRDSKLTSSPSEMEIFKSGCLKFSDGPALLFSVLFGWVAAAIYTGWWEIIWHQYHKRKTKLIGEPFKTDWVNKIVVFASVAIPALLSVYAGVNWLRH